MPTQPTTSIKPIFYHGKPHSIPSACQIQLTPYLHIKGTRNMAQTQYSTSLLKFKSISMEMFIKIIASNTAIKNS